MNVPMNFEFPFDVNNHFQNGVFNIGAVVFDPAGLNLAQHVQYIPALPMGAMGEVHRPALLRIEVRATFPDGHVIVFPIDSNVKVVFIGANANRVLLNPGLQVPAAANAAPVVPAIIPNQPNEVIIPEAQVGGYRRRKSTQKGGGWRGPGKPRRPKRPGSITPRPSPRPSPSPTPNRRKITRRRK